jgi:hypothetical protein
MISAKSENQFSKATELVKDLKTWLIGASIISDISRICVSGMGIPPI